MMDSQQLLGNDSSLADSQSFGAVFSPLAAASPEGLRMSLMAVPMELRMPDDAATLA